jgi:hypothetical protein
MGASKGAGGEGGKEGARGRVCGIVCDPMWLCLLRAPAHTSPYIRVRSKMWGWGVGGGGGGGNPSSTKNLYPHMYYHLKIPLNRRATLFQPPLRRCSSKPKGLWQNARNPDPTRAACRASTLASLCR